MIIVKLMGGLGNQMFQYAAAKSLALLTQTKLKIDVSFLNDRTPRENFTYRDFKLDIFKLSFQIATSNEIQRFLTKPFSNKKIDRIRQKYNPHFIVRENSVNFNTELFNQSHNTYLEGYFQSEKYFISFENEIRDDFIFNRPEAQLNLEMVQKIKDSNSIAIHFRRGDYISNPITNKFHGVCGIDYYKKAVESMNSKITDPVFFVFSDDIEWVKQNFKANGRVIYVDSSSESEDLQLMSICKNHIIANSSYSWWGAWLARRNEQKVIAPKQWFTNYALNPEDLIPLRWERI